MKKKTFLILLPVLAILFSCSSTKINDQQRKLREAFKNQNIDKSWHFETTENDSTKISLLKNKDIKGQILFSTPDTSLLYGYFLEENKTTGTRRYFIAELTRKDSLLYIEMKDPGNKVISRLNFPAMKNEIPENGDNPPPPSPCPYSSLEECVDRFAMSSQFEELQEQANKTCRLVRTAVICCSKDGNSYCVLFAISPNAPRCVIYPYENILTR